MADITRRRNLNPRRRNRSYPRVVKRARHNSYRVKRPGDTGVSSRKSCGGMPAGGVTMLW